MFQKIFLSIFIVLIVSGCSVHKRQPIETLPFVPESFIEEERGAYAVYPIGKWWEQFDDEKLNALMEEAFQDNLDITVAFARLEQVQAVTRATAAAQKPFLDVEGEVKRESSPSFLGDYTGNSYQISLLAGYEVDLWEKYKSQTKAASLETEATYEDIKALYMNLSAQLVELYYLAVEQRAQLSLTDSTIVSFEEALERVELRYRQGLAPALDVYQAQQNLARARAGRPVFEANLAVTEHALATLLGRYPDRETAGELAIIPEIPNAFPAGIPSEMLARRPDIQAAILRVKASDEKIAVAIADRFPSFNLIGSYGKSSMAFVTGDIVGVFWNAILNVAQPIFDGGRRSAEVDRTRAVFKENLAMYHKAVLTAFQEVEDALARNRTSEEHIILLGNQSESSSSALRVSTFRYMEGLSDYLPVLAAQQSHYESESAILSARRQLISDRVQLARALGGEWMHEYIDEHFIADNEEENKQ